MRRAAAAEHDRLVREIENLTRGIAQGGDIPALAAALDDRDRRLMTITAELSKPVAIADRDTLHAALLRREAGAVTGPRVAGRGILSIP